MLTDLPCRRVTNDALDFRREINVMLYGSDSSSQYLSKGVNHRKVREGVEKNDDSCLNHTYIENEKYEIRRKNQCCVILQ